MTVKSYLDGRVTLHCGDCITVLASMPENSVDSIVCDPPYHLHSIVKRFAKTGRTESTASKSGPHQRTATGFMGKQWDGGDVAFNIETWQACLRVLKPGGYIVAFSSSRTFGRMSVAIEDAGFITHPLIGWIFGSGFPKAHNAARAIDRVLGHDGSKTPQGEPVRRIRPGADQHKDGTWEKLEDRTYQPGRYVPATPEAAAWDGWAYGGQALKPALEPIYCGQKPYSEDGGARNLLKHGVGALNIDGCRVETQDATERPAGIMTSRGHEGGSFASQDVGHREIVMQSGGSDLGRWPANLCHDGSHEVLAAFPDAPGQLADASASTEPRRTQNVYGAMTRGNGRAGEASADRRYTEEGATNFAALPGARRDDAGSAARFFYTAKADAEDRLGSKHPTVKPLDLMQWLVRLVTPPKGTVLDPFAGTGTTGEAAWREGMNAILIEREPEYQADIERRMDLATQPTKRAAVAKTKNKLDDPNDLPLFAEVTS